MNCPVSSWLLLDREAYGGERRSGLKTVSPPVPVTIRFHFSERKMEDGHQSSPDLQLADSCSLLEGLVSFGKVTVLTPLVQFININ